MTVTQITARDGIFANFRFEIQMGFLCVSNKYCFKQAKRDNPSTCWFQVEKPWRAKRMIKQ